MASDLLNLTLNGVFSLLWCWERYPKMAFWISVSNNLLRGTPKVRWRMKKKNLFKGKRRRRHMAEKIHPFDAFFGHGCIASHVATDPPPPPPPRVAAPFENGTSFVNKNFALSHTHHISSHGLNCYLHPSRGSKNEIHDHRHTGPVVVFFGGRGGGGGWGLLPEYRQLRARRGQLLYKKSMVIAPIWLPTDDIFSIHCSNIKWFCPNITCFCLKIAII